MVLRKNLGRLGRTALTVGLLTLELVQSSDHDGYLVVQRKQVMLMITQATGSCSLQTHQLVVLLPAAGYRVLVAHGFGEQAGRIDIQWSLCFTSPGEQLIDQALLSHKDGQLVTFYPDDTSQKQRNRWFISALKDC